MPFPQNLLVRLHGGREVHIRDFGRGVGDGERTCAGNVTMNGIVTREIIKGITWLQQSNTEKIQYYKFKLMQN